MTREEQAQKRRQEILLASLDLFIAKGYHGTSTRQISQKVGISSGLLFHYFADKDALYCELIKIAAQRMQFSIAVGEENPDAYLCQMVSKVFSLLVVDAFFAKLFVFIHQGQYTEGIPEEGQKMLTAGNLVKVCSKIILKGQEMGQFRAGDAGLLATTFLCAINGIAQEKVRVPKQELPEAEWIMDIVRR